MDYSNKKVLVVIPARYASTRFPGKPLALINGMYMIQHVYQNALKSKLASKLVVATDDERIYTAVQNFGGEVIMTSDKHNNGTERVAEVLRKLSVKEKYDIVVNVQGDEPFVSADDIDKLICLFEKQEVQIATLAHKIAQQQAEDYNRVKLIRDVNNKVLYFSRSLIPFKRYALEQVQYYQHIGMYAFRAETLLSIVTLASTPLEQTEGLEQLRWLENGYSIYADISENESKAIDTPQDLEAVIKGL